MAHRINRRVFLFGTLASAALARSVARAQGAAEKLRLGVIGTGGQGAFNWSNVASEEIVTLCDVDLARVARAKERFPNAEVVQDFRRVIDRHDLDAVLVSTPDHWHAIPSVWAMETGKHVYCEKPLAHSVSECRVMAETARKQKRVTQMGTQIHAGANYRRVVELIRAGAIGEVQRVDVWHNGRPQSGKRAAAGTPPPTLDYELWVGPAPMRPYDPNIIPFRWRWWWDFGGGVLGDMGCHYMDLPFWALELRHPERIAATGTENPDSDTKMPVEMRVDYHYPRGEGKAPLPLTWWHGVPGPKDEAGQLQTIMDYRSGVLFHGADGQLVADYDRHQLLPEEKFKEYRRPEPTIPDSLGHHREWIQAIKNGGPTTCNFDYSGALAEAVLLGNVAYRLGREVQWDAKKLRVTNAAEKEWGPLIRPEYRGEWKLKR